MALNFASTFLSLVSGKKQLSIPVNSNPTSANAGQVIGLNSAGKVDPSMLVNPAFSLTTVASPTGPQSTSAFTMQGLDASITPVTTGNIECTINATITEAGSGTGYANSGISYQQSYGTGSAPANGAAITGTQIGLVQTSKIQSNASAAADISMAISITCIVSGLTLNTAYWFDLAAEYVGATKFQFTNVVVCLKEI